MKSHLVFYFCCDHEVFRVKIRLVFHHVWSIDVTRAKKERIYISHPLPPILQNFAIKSYIWTSLICGLEWLVLQSRWSAKVRCDRKMLVYRQLLSYMFSCTCLVNSVITFVFKVVTLIFFVLAEYESKKMWSKFDNVTPLMEREEKSLIMKKI